MATNITWVDPITATEILNNGKPAPGDRFTSFTPFPDLIGPVYAPLGTGRNIIWIHRTDYCATFQLTQIPRTKQTQIDRLIRFLWAGGDVTLNTGDAASRTYTCHLRAGSTPTYEFSDHQNIEYTLSMELVNNAAAPLVCEY